MSPEQQQISECREHADSVYAQKAAIINRITPIHKRFFVEKVSLVDVAHEEALDIDFAIKKEVAKQRKNNPQATFTEAIDHLSAQDGSQHIFSEHDLSSKALRSEIKQKKKLKKQAEKYAQTVVGMSPKEDKILARLSEQKMHQAHLDYFARIATNSASDRISAFARLPYSEAFLVGYVNKLHNNPVISLESTLMEEQTIDTIRHSESIKKAICSDIFRDVHDLLKRNVRDRPLNIEDQLAPWYETGIISEKELGVEEKSRKILRKGINSSIKKDSPATVMQVMEAVRSGGILSDAETRPESYESAIIETLITVAERLGPTELDYRLDEWESYGVELRPFNRLFKKTLQEALDEYQKNRELEIIASQERRRQREQTELRRLRYRENMDPIDRFFDSF